MSHLKVFGCKCFILNNGKDNLGKFDLKSNEGIFFGYSLHGYAYRAFNKRTMLVEESMHIAFDETNHNMQENSKTGADDEFPNIQQADTGLENKLNNTSKLPETQLQDQGVQSTESGVGTGTIHSELPREWRVPINLSLDNVIG